MLEFLKTAYGQVTVLAAGVGTVWGLFKAAGALKKWFTATKFWTHHVQEKAIPHNTLVLLQDIDKRMQDNDEAVAEIRKTIELIKHDLFINNESTATMMLEKMMWAYHTYVLQGNPIPLDVRTALCAMYDQYKTCEWHNHVPEDFKERINACKILG